MRFAGPFFFAFAVCGFGGVNSARLNASSRRAAVSFSSLDFAMVNTKKRRKSRLSRLSREHPTTEEANAVIDSMLVSAPIATAILGAGLVEHDLDRLLRDKIKVSDEMWNELTSESGPLRSLSSKILMGHALKIYDEKLRQVLDVMRTIRNVFAHAKKLINFAHPDIVSELRAVGAHPSRRFGSFKKLADADEEEAKHAYVALCIGLSTTLMKIKVKKQEARVRHYKRKQRNRLVDSLLHVTNGQPSALARYLKPFQGDQTDGPSTGVWPSNFLSEYAAKLRTDRSGGTE